MNLAIVHYHLNRGGVTRVIENQLVALDTVLDRAEPWRVALIYGGRRDGWNEDLPATLNAIRLSLHELPALDYDQQPVGHALAYPLSSDPVREDMLKHNLLVDPVDYDPQCENAQAGGSKSLADQLAGLLDEIGFFPQDAILHVHNHALGKNSSLPPSLMQLAGEGYRLLLQVHDFPEDFRPDNYRCLCAARLEGPDPAAALYPQAPHIHYAVLNGRDYEILQAAGVATGRLHRLPNPVPELDRLPPKHHARRRLAERFAVGPQERFGLYPVRCIRRKNVGEVLLYAALAPPQTVLGLTLPPLNPAEVPTYEGWKRLAAELDLPCRFDVGAPGGLSFGENLAAADLILTTSLAEGFGMVFLESWLAGRPLIGRDLPEITRDFTALGIRFDWLRSRLDVPVEWVGVNTFRQTILEAYQRTLQAYGRDEPEDLAGQLEAKIADGLVDFGDLDETLQRQVLRLVCQDHKHRRRMLQANPWVEPALSIRRDAVTGVIEQNAQVVQRHLSRVTSGRRLLELYSQVAAGPRDQRPEPLPDVSRILDKFLAFRRFRPIRS